MPNSASPWSLRGRPATPRPHRVQPGCRTTATDPHPPKATLVSMVVISSWSVDDKPQSRLGTARELLTVWAVHLSRSYRLLRGA
jgi:hypothetical protein